ncbi:MAG TPA: hypothetical protein VKU93_01685 [Terracidiphilus sp.]|jgi:hypothetical protein|nr:hypothetical protein [Terracidiphilus sp.]
MPGRALDFLLAEILLFLLFPIFALGFLLRKLILLLRRQMGWPAECKQPPRAPVRPLVFARAIEAYEELIDMTAQASDPGMLRGMARARQK